MTLPLACGLTGFRQNSLNLLQSNTSMLKINSSFLQTHGEAFQIKVTGRGKQGFSDSFEIVCRHDITLMLHTHSLANKYEVKLVHKLKAVILYVCSLK